MIVKKLTLTPIISEGSKIVIYRPSTEHAQYLMNCQLESLNRLNKTKIPRRVVLARIPKAIKKFLNI